MDASEEDPNNSISNFYKTDMLLIKKFLLEYSVGIADTFKYLLLLRSIKNRVLKVLEVELDDMLEFDPTEMPSVCGRIEANGKRYIELFSQALDSILADDEELPPDPNVISDSIDILQRQRKHQNELLRQRYEADNNPDNNDANAQMNQGGVAADGESKEAVEIDFPVTLIRRYELRLLPRSSTNNGPLPSASLRHIRSSSIGKLVKIKGMITRCSEVKPHCEVCTYTCDGCHCEVYQEIKGRSYTPLRSCPQCSATNANTNGSAAPTGGSANADTLHAQTRGSKFVKFQELKLQELPNQVPIGHIPRCMSVHCHGEITRVASPGDTVTITGIFLPQKYEGFKGMQAGLITDTYLHANGIEVHKKSYDENVDLTNVRLSQKVEAVATAPDPVGRLARSIAPEIFGHSDVKRAMLLQLVGGVSRKLPDGMRIRGDINICLMGDPGVAKSQLLKYIASVAPRGVYTTGKGSSGVGLTAAITKDITTGDMALEGGALVLADKGVCCIDEFDKMDESDRTAIHEVMEQQTVSIAKAGITATLNARAAVLAAANPLYGRYNRKKGLSENINLPNSLLSRFDLMFLILDVANVDNDMALARHVTFVHKHNGTEAKQVGENGGGNSNSNIHGLNNNMEDSSDSSDSSDDENEMKDDINSNTNNNNDDDDDDDKPLDPEVVKEYISRARQHHPSVPKDVAPYIVEAYVALRKQDHDNMGQGGGGNNHAVNHNNFSSKQSNTDQTVMTARQLLSILRLSQALARLRFSDFVAREDVDEAIRLTHMSKASLLDEEEGMGGKRGEDVISKIYGIIRDYRRSVGNSRVELSVVESMVVRKGFTSEQFATCLEEYTNLNVLQVNSVRTHVDFLS